MNYPILRILRIQRILLRYLINRTVLPTRAVRLRRWSYLNPYSWRKGLPRGVVIHAAIVELGTIFVKFGQVLSTRRDIIPPDIADELAKLQDRVPPFPGKEAVAIIERALGQKISEIFSEFSEEALAAASVAQVHAATLKNNDKVVVKVIRPNIATEIAKDIAVLYYLAKWFNRFYKNAEYIHALEIVQEFEMTIYDELNLQREAANAAQLRRNFSDSPLMYVPRIYWDYTSTEVMVQERVYGVPISDIATLRKYEVNLKKLAEYGVKIFFTQVFRDCFFHADMHPGNLFVDIRDPENPRYVGVDFGIMGTLNPSDQRYLAEIFLAFFNHDYQRMAEVHIESGWVPPDARIDQLESAFRTICEPFYAKPLGEISYGLFLLQLLQTAERFKMHVQPQLLLLQKTLLNVEGLGRELYPQLDLWQTAKPYLEEWAWQNMGFKLFLQKIRQKFPRCSHNLREIVRELAIILGLKYD